MKALILPQSLGLLLLVLIFWGPLENSSLKFLIDKESVSLESLALTTELMIEAKTAESVNIPLVSGSFDGVSEVFLKGQQWLSYSSIILAAQIMIITISKTLVIKIIAVVFWIGVFIPKIRSISIKLLLVFFLLNPGLPAFVYASQQFGKEVQIDFGSSLNEKLKSNYQTYKKKEESRETKLEDLKKKQKAENSDGKLNIFQRIGDDVKQVAGKVEDEVSLVYKDSAEVLKQGSKELVQDAINLFSHILVSFVLLPFGYFYLFKILFEHIIGGKINLEALKNFKS